MQRIADSKQNQQKEVSKLCVPKNMEMELDFLEQLLLEQEVLLETDRTDEAIEKYEMLIRITKVVQAESLNMKLREMMGHYDIATIAQRLLNESATAYISGNADSAEIRVVDEIHHNTMAEFKARIGKLHCLLFSEVKFC